LANANVPQFTTTVTGGTTATPATVNDGLGNEVQTFTLGGTSGGSFSPLFAGVAPVGLGTSEVQLLALPGTIANGNTFTLTLAGQVTGAITYNTTPATTAANIQSALNTTYGVGLFTVSPYATTNLLNFVITA